LGATSKQSTGVSQEAFIASETTNFIITILVIRSSCFCCTVAEEPSESSSGRTFVAASVFSSLFRVGRFTPRGWSGVVVGSLVDMAEPRQKPLTS
jgi:hypothetical protein